MRCHAALWASCTCAARTTAAAAAAAAQRCAQPRRVYTVCSDGGGDGAHAAGGGDVTAHDDAHVDRVAAVVDDDHAARTTVDDGVVVRYCGEGVYYGHVREPYGYHDVPPTQLPVAHATTAATAATTSSPSSPPRHDEPHRSCHDSVGDGGSAGVTTARSFVLSPVCTHAGCLWQWRAVRCTYLDNTVSGHSPSAALASASYVVLPFLLLPCASEHALHPYIDPVVLERCYADARRRNRRRAQPWQRRNVAAQAQELLVVPSVLGDLVPVSSTALLMTRLPPQPAWALRTAYAHATAAEAWQKAAQWYTSMLHTLRAVHTSHTTSATSPRLSAVAPCDAVDARSEDAAPLVAHDTHRHAVVLPQRDGDETAAAYTARCWSAIRHAAATTTTTEQADATSTAQQEQQQQEQQQQPHMQSDTMTPALPTHVYSAVDRSDGAYTRVFVNDDTVTNAAAHAAALQTTTTTRTDTHTTTPNDAAAALATERARVADDATGASDVPYNVLCGGIADMALAVDRYAAMVTRKSCTVADACMAVLRDSPCPYTAMRLRMHPLEIEREVYAAVQARMMLLTPAQGNSRHTWHEPTCSVLTLDDYARLARWTT